MKYVQLMKKLLINRNQNQTKNQRKHKSVKSKRNQLIEELKNSLSVGNQSIRAIEKHNFDKLKEAKKAIISILNELEFH
jgi:membrane protein involved in colicin uptake